jgi:preprotein translocase subunit YajC
MWQLCDDASGHLLNKGDQVVTSEGEIGRIKSISPNTDCVVIKYGDNTEDTCKVARIGAKFAADECEQAA